MHYFNEFDAMKRWAIYVLKDPRTDEVRYVGITHNLRRRYSDHLRDARRGEQTHKACWIRMLAKSGVKPTQEVVEWVEKDDREAAEKRWIAHYRHLGVNLTNLTDGGPAFDGLPREILDRIAAGNRGRKHTEAAKKLIGDACRGKERPAEVREKIAKKHVGKVLTAEHREKLAAAKRGKKMPPRAASHRKAISDGLIRAWERRRAAAQDVAA